MLISLSPSVLCFFYVKRTFRCQMCCSHKHKQKLLLQMNCLSLLSLKNYHNGDFISQKISMIKFYLTLFSSLAIEHFLEQGTLGNIEMKNNLVMDLEKQISPQIVLLYKVWPVSITSITCGLVRNVNLWTQPYLVKQKLCLNKSSKEPVFKALQAILTQIKIWRPLLEYKINYD